MNGLLLALSFLACDTTDSIAPYPLPFWDISAIQITLVHEEEDTVFSGSLWEYLSFLLAVEDAGYEVEVKNGNVIFKRKEDTIGNTDR